MRLTLLTSVLASVALIVGACANDEDIGTGALELETTQPNRGAVTRVIGATGKVIPREEVLVGSEVSGRVDEVLVDFNSVVAEGDVLARIDPTNTRNQVAQIRGSIASASAEIDVARASIARSEASLAQARRNMTRQSGLFAQEAVSSAQMEAAERDVAIGEADLALAEARLVSQEASLSQARARLAIAQADLERTTIRSPIDGVVIDRKIDPGQTVQASFSSPELFVIAADLSQIEVEARVVESDVAGMEAGDAASFTVDAYPDDTVEGVVEQLRLKSSENNNIVSYTAIIVAPNPDERLLPGMTANLQITTLTKPDVLRLPVKAERFRPSPDNVAMFRAEGAAVEKVGLLEPTLARMRIMGVSDARIASFTASAEAATQKVRDVLNDPGMPWMHARMRTQFAEIMDAEIKGFLEADEFKTYSEMVVAERTIRPVELWVADGAGKMVKRTVRLGLSDGTNVEVVDGLEEGDAVVIGFADASTNGPPGEGGAQSGRAR